MSLFLLDDTLRVTAFYDRSSENGEICLYFEEDPPDLFRNTETRLPLSPAQAKTLVQALLEALQEREKDRTYPIQENNDEHHG
ncbi:hypothetical protein [Anaerolinea sp.]|uniref:hypothetical protein n=1 Tax=Anaerolinea sp. TaxID=1872519 RepID=UPI002ACE9B68|nr:hypothetical protein [Anaerolinea sp.]